MEKSFIKPEEIEAESFRIIAEELKERGISILEEEAPVTMRVIHTTADFDYAGTLRFSENAVSVLRRLLEQGTRIVTDTNMAKSGINKGFLSRYGGEALCFMAEADVAAEAADVPGGLASVLKVLMDADIDIEYTYAFVVENGARACAILRLSDTELGEKILSEAGVPMVSEEDILRI